MRRQVEFINLPEELQRHCAGYLDLPSAWRFAQASRASEVLVHVRLAEGKADHDAARAAAAAKLAQPLRRIAFTAGGGAFIDARLDEFIGASPAARKALVHGILVEAAARETELCAANWTAKSVFSRLKNARSLRSARNVSV